MSYRSKFSIANLVPGRWGNLFISRDYDTNPKKQYPVFLYTPDMEDTDNHYHIPLTPNRAKKLHKWLGEYLKEQDRITKTGRK